MDPKESRKKWPASVDESDEANDSRPSEEENTGRRVAKIQNGTMPEAQTELNGDRPTTKTSHGCANPVVPNSSQTANGNNSSRCGPDACKMAKEKISHADSDIRNNVDYTLGIEKCPAKVSCAAESAPDTEIGWKAAYPPLRGSINDIGANRIGSTSQGTCRFLRPNINGTTRDDEAGPSTVKHESNDRGDSSSGNEGDLSDVEDYCIYTYKGNDQGTKNRPMNDERSEDREEALVAAAAAAAVAAAAAAAAGQPSSGRSSPEMDYLEMDFDPGPSCEQDTGDSDLASINEDIQNLQLDNVDSDPLLLNDLSGGKVVARQQLSVAEESTIDVPPVAIQPERNVVVDDPADSRANETGPGHNRRGSNCTSPGSRCMPSTSAGLRQWEATSLNRSVGGCPLRESYSYHNTSGDLISPGDSRDTEAELWAENSTVSIPESSNSNTRKNNLSSTLYHRMMAKKLMLNKQTTFNQSGDSNLESELCSVRLDEPAVVPKVMLWSEQEATIKQVTQIATSACGATSAINALLSLDVPFSLEVLVKGVATRLREPGAPLPRYLASRSWAGATHKDIIRGISLATNGAVITKFFAFYPERNVSLSHWLHYWISRGAAPVATLNLQNCGTGLNIPDAWHHQMIFGVSQSGIYMTNPLECLPEQLLWHQLASPSILLIKRSDVLAHWNPATDLTPLMRFDKHWRKLNVLGQVVNLIRETMGERKQPTSSTIGASHIRIPASFQAGITLIMRTDAPAAEELLHAEQLSLL